MTLTQAREAAHHWVATYAPHIPGFCGAYTAGSTNWLSDNTTLPPTSDFDIMVVLANPSLAGRREKFSYHGILLEVSYLSSTHFTSPALILGDYHLAPSFRTTNILLDPSGVLTALLAAVCRDYTQPAWIAKRCAHARTCVLDHLRSIEHERPLHDQVLAFLFAAGVTTHILLVAGLKNPTVRTRYAAVRELLSDHGHRAFHETLLQLLGSAQIERGRVRHHLTALADIFDAAKQAMQTPVPFASDLSVPARSIAIEGSLGMLERGDHREAMFWIAVTHSRCRKVLLQDAPQKLTHAFRNSYRELLADLGLSSLADVRRRSAAVDRSLPQVWELAELIIASNRKTLP